MVNRRYFEGLLAANKMSLRSLANKMEMNHSQLSLTFSGTRKMQIEEAAKLARIFGEPLYRIIENTGVKVWESGVRSTVIGFMTGDGVVNLHGSDVLERTTAPNGMPEGTVAAQCRTASSSLEWMDGWVFFFARPEDVHPSIVGRLSICKIAKGPAVIAAVKRGYAENTFSLIGPYRAENVHLEWATPIVLTRN